MSALALLAREDDFSGILWFVLFFLFPLVARLLKWVGEKAKGGAATSEADPRTARRLLREERRQAEAEGEDLWRRLARGEAPEPVRPMPVPVPVPARRSLEIEPEERSLEEEREPEPLSVLGEVSEPSEAPESSLEREEEPVPLAALAAAPALEEAEPPVARVLARLGRSELRRAMVLSEVLGPPVSERALRA